MLSKVDNTNTISNIAQFYKNYTLGGTGNLNKYLGLVGTSVRLIFNVTQASSSTNYYCYIFKNANNNDFGTFAQETTVTTTGIQTINITKSLTSPIFLSAGSYFRATVDVYIIGDLNKVTFTINELIPLEVKAIGQKAKTNLFGEENIKETKLVPTVGQYVKQYSASGNSFTKDNTGFFVTPEKGWYIFSIYSVYTSDISNKFCLLDENGTYSAYFLYQGYASNSTHTLYNTVPLLLDKGQVIAAINAGTSVRDGYVIQHYKIKYA